MLSFRDQPLVQACGEGRGSATPKCHIPHTPGRPGLPTCPGTECLLDQTKGEGPGGLLGGGERALSASAQTLGYLGHIWSPVPSLSSCQLGMGRARPRTERKKNVLVPALISGFSAPFSPANFPPTRILQGNSPPQEQRV